jgi:hypothetical protein
MKKIVRLTESDLTKIVKRVINEQKFQILSKLLSNSGDDFIKAYGDDVAKQFDNTFTRLLSSTKTSGVNALNKQVLKLADGTDVELELITRIMNAASKGADVNKLASYLPMSKLADGTNVLATSAAERFLALKEGNSVGDPFRSLILFAPAA